MKRFTTNDISEMSHESATLRRAMTLKIVEDDCSDELKQLWHNILDTEDVFLEQILIQLNYLLDEIKDIRKEVDEE